MHQFDLFVEIMGGTEGPEVPNYPTNTTLEAKHKFISPEAAKVLNELELEIFSKLLTKVTSYSKKRNKLAHWSWGFAENFPSCLLLARPGQFVLENIDHSKVFVFKEDDFIDIVDENDQLSKTLRHFCGILRSPPSESRDTLLHLLATDLGVASSA